MSASNTSQAIIAKARAMYGKRLTDKDYSNLLGCDSVPEVLSYLKTHTKYAPLLNDLSENSIHRAQLEVILRQQLFSDFESLCRYEISVGEGFAKYVIIRTEIEQIMHFLMLLSSNRSQEYLYSLPVYFIKLSKIELNALPKARNYDDFLAALVRTPYYKLLLPYKPKTDEKIDLPEIENALNGYAYSFILKIVNKQTKGSEKEELKRFFNNELDMRNFVRILRLKKYYKYSPDKIQNELLPYGSLNKNKIAEMCAAEDSKSVFAIMQSTGPGRIISKLEYSFAGEITQRAMFDYCVHELRFSVHPSVALICYVTLAEIELSNVINIIEGVRYKVDASRIKDLLTYTS